MGSSVCRALRHSGRGDEPGMASQAGSAVSEILDLANIPRGIAIEVTMPPCRGGLSVGPRRHAATEPEFLDPVGVEDLADENLRIVADGQVIPRSPHACALPLSTHPVPLTDTIGLMKGQGSDDRDLTRFQGRTSQACPGSARCGQNATAIQSLMAFTKNELRTIIRL